MNELILVFEDIISYTYLLQSPAGIIQENRLSVVPVWV